VQRRDCRLDAERSRPAAKRLVDKRQRLGDLLLTFVEDQIDHRQHRVEARGHVAGVGH
jgi:hypothetical protein